MKVRLHEDERFPTLYVEEDALGYEVDDQVLTWFNRAQDDFRAAESALARSYIENGGQGLTSIDWDA